MEAKRERLDAALSFYFYMVFVQMIFLTLLLNGVLVSVEMQIKFNFIEFLSLSVIEK